MDEGKGSPIDKEIWSFHPRNFGSLMAIHPHHRDKREMSHFLASVGACNALIMHTHVVVN